jgi:hypothetical protein
MSVLSNHPIRVSALATTAAVTAATAALTVVIAPPALAGSASVVRSVTTVDSATAQTKVVDLRVGAHRHFDRVVVDLVGRIPTYDVRYVRHLRYDGSGERVPLRGRKFVLISLTPARAHSGYGEHGSDIYAGPHLRQYAFDTLRGVALAGDFEAAVTIGLSLRRHTHLRVFVLHAPNRLVVDLRH